MPSPDTPGATGGPDQIATRLKVASEIVEDCAFLAADGAHADVIAELIILAADLDRLAQGFRKNPGEKPNDTA